MCIIFFFFKQKTAYEISACLVGSEMCIRDSPQRGYFPQEEHSTTDSFNSQHYHTSDIYIHNEVFPEHYQELYDHSIKQFPQNKPIFRIIKRQISKSKQQQQVGKPSKTVSHTPRVDNSQETLAQKQIEKDIRKEKREKAKNRRKSTMEFDSCYHEGASSVDSLVLCKLESTSGEDLNTQKKIKQMIRNRMSAQQSRDKMKNYVKTLEVENENLRLENEALRKQLIEIEGTVGEESCQENSKIGQSQEEMLKYLYNSVSAYAPQGIITQKKEALQHLL
eukprot:TRINITY_DN928_c0_g1_i8.p1 TRINITY_DN928_c0_g1~~TRINITY_DN928_c0_g1_i8.p1  ORF type:complete len:278 (+),score=59.94 TRINITY_DN928_c0_g1_i8:1-834(+)